MHIILIEYHPENVKKALSLHDVILFKGAV